jgi:hypothetical protein
MILNWLLWSPELIEYVKFLRLIYVGAPDCRLSLLKLTIAGRLEISKMVQCNVFE